jgi:poly(hydroxyalkanoate) depolymerase family esterase
MTNSKRPGEPAGVSWLTRAWRLLRRLNVARLWRAWRGRAAEEDRARPLAEALERPAGEFVAGVHAGPAGTRPYKLYIPADCAKAPALVVMLHGCTQSADSFAGGTHMNARADERKCLVLYPEQTRGANQSRCWNWYQRGDQRRGEGEPAIIAGMTHEVMERYRVDRRRVYVAGLSAGGAMAAILGATYPDLFAAIGVHSGLVCGSAHDLSSALVAMRGMAVIAPEGDECAESTLAATPTIVFHGDRDRTVDPQNGERFIAESVRRDGASAGGVATEEGRAPGGHAYTRSVYRDRTGRVMLEHWLVHGGGHAWFGGSPRGSYADPRGPDASGEFMRFFYQNTLVPA